MNISIFKLIIFSLISLIILAPICIIIVNGMLSILSYNEIYLTRYFFGTLILILGVSGLVLIISIPLAWVNTMTDYTGRKLIQTLSVLPLAVPAYISAYTYSEILEPGGYLSLLFNSFNGFSIRNYFFASLIIAASLFPYVYLLTRIAIINFSARYIEAAKTMGKNGYECFLYICIPMAIPGIAAGLALTIMETTNDFGVADYFGLQTLSVGVFHYISIINELPSAFILSFIIIILMACLYILENYFRGNKKFHNSSYENIKWSRYKLSLKSSFVVFITSLVPILFGYIIPLIFIFNLVLINLNIIDFDNFITSLSNSILLGALVGFVCISVSIFINYFSRFSKNKFLFLYKKFINVGYAIPGVVIAFGVLFLVYYLDLISNLAITASLVGLVIALVTRLISISNNSLESGLDKIGKSIDDASRLIGRRQSTTYFRIILPQVKLSILAGFFLVFVDSIKELPITLLLRPFNFNTLATSLYEYSSNEMFEYGSLHALTIIVFLSLAIYIFENILEKKVLFKD